MTAPQGRIARFDLIDGQMILHSKAGGWVFYDDHTAAIAAAEVRGFRAVMKRLGAPDCVIDELLAAVPAPPADGGEG